jgi:N-glycosidase YbiA
MLPIPEDNRILYFGRDRETFGFLWHFWPSVITLEDEIWPTVEHYYQAHKSDSHAYRAAVRAAVTPAQAKRLAANPHASGKAGRHSWFRANGKEPRADWNEVKLDIMRSADWAKFSQNPDLAELLLGTGDATLIEDSPSEPFWGIGPQGTGENWAGRVLMEVRERLKVTRPPGDA